MKLVSIITPFFNAEAFLSEAIQSVLDQDYQHWELILVNDGSRDGSEAIVKSFKDPRIGYYYQENGGVSAARNLGLTKMRGAFICFLDADDKLTPYSLSLRMNIFEKNTDVDFIDGIVAYFGGKQRRDYVPFFEGKPLLQLLQLDRSCFFGPSWLIRCHPEVRYFFRENLKHSEDLVFYLDICYQRNGDYTYVDQKILNYRLSSGSAMGNLAGLEMGYAELIGIVREMEALKGLRFWKFKLRVVRIMFLSYLMDGKDMKNSVLSFFRLIVK